MPHSLLLPLLSLSVVANLLYYTAAFFHLRLRYSIFTSLPLSVLLPFPSPLTPCVQVRHRRLSGRLATARKKDKSPPMTGISKWPRLVPTKVKENGIFHVTLGLVFYNDRKCLSFDYGR
jgi:hypothetical protein